VLLALWYLIPASGGAVLALLSATSLPRNRHNWWRATVVIAVASAIANAAFIILRASPLYRDAIALSAAALLCVFLVGTIGSLLRDRVAALRAIASALVVCAFALTAPYVVLLAHCTSGDCL
jgi:hypothetical protein